MKRRRSVKRRSSARSFKRVKRYARRSIKGVTLIQPDAIAYGALRQPISTQVMKLAANLPMGGVLGQYLDNIAMAGVSYIAAKKGSGMIKQIGIKGLVAENVLLGADLGSNIFKSVNNSVDEYNTNW